MKTRWMMGTAGVIVGAVAVAGGVGAISADAAGDSLRVASAEAYKIDGVHSGVVFRVKHMGVSNFWGRFNKVSGSFAWDSAAPEATSVDVTIDAASIDSNNKQRDGHLNSPDFFNTKEFPTITFKSKSLKKAGENWELVGDLTLLGKSKEITAKFTPVGEKTTDKGALAGFDVAFTIKRSDFGMKYGVENGALGDEVEVMAGFEGNRK